MKPDEMIDDAQDREMFIEIIFVFPDSTEESIPAFEHVIYSSGDGKLKAKIRLEAR